MQYVIYERISKYLILGLWFIFYAYPTNGQVLLLLFVWDTIYIKYLICFLKRNINFHVVFLLTTEVHNILTEKYCGISRWWETWNCYCRLFNSFFNFFNCVTTYFVLVTTNSFTRHQFPLLFRLDALSSNCSHRLLNNAFFL